MVAVVIGLVGILAMTQAYITSDRFNRSTVGEGGAQTNGLLGLYQIERDARMSGYGIADSKALGCGTIDWYYDPNYSASITPGSPLPTLTLAPITITTNGTDPDLITIMFATGDERLLPTTISNFVAASSEVSVDGTAGFKAGDLILLVNNSSPTVCTLGQITQVQAGPQKLQLNPGASGPYNPPAWGSFPGTYAPGDQLLNLGNPVIRTYSINNNKLRVTDALLQVAGATPLDVVDGIVDLRAQYGKDNGAGGGTVGDGIVDESKTRRRRAQQNGNRCCRCASPCSPASASMKNPQAALPTATQRPLPTRLHGPAAHSRKLMSLRSPAKTAVTATGYSRPSFRCAT